MCGGKLLFSRLPGGSEASEREADDDAADADEDELGSALACLVARGDAVAAAMLLLSVSEPSGRATGAIGTAEAAAETPLDSADLGADEG